MIFWRGEDHPWRLKFSKTLPLLQPPETRFPDEPLSFASEVWTLAYFWLAPIVRDVLPADNRVTAEQVEVLGILPSEWWERWSRGRDWFNEEGELNELEARSEAGLETMTEKERRAFEVMLRSMPIYRPNERATAQQVLHSE
ncbi:hypothetical protein N7463_006341 [Penicillium fimorum]|uniref:Protein kinase domain-containing protein n=1 Tax=Penicillium fimorum TaxID=1882269 RepID=A0A9X0C628_9EURO|nr:hypothetical protein N7463_006341 [Penicillium fimorum]